MQAIVQMVKEPGAKDTAMLHAAAMKLSVTLGSRLTLTPTLTLTLTLDPNQVPLGCEWTQLWLVEHAGHRQQVTTQHKD